MENEIREELRRFVLESPSNRFPGSKERFFDEPLVGFTAADDPLFTEYKKIIGDFHLTPEELFSSTPVGCDARPATVISYVLPITEMTRESNRTEIRFPSLPWAQTRTFGEEFNNALRRHFVDFLVARGHRAVAPHLHPDWRLLGDSPVGIASSWSERHAAYAAGLGTFSLNDGLITEKGIAHRCGSVITDLSLAPTRRTGGDHRSNCLHYREGGCGLCIGRCPAGALSRGGHDKARCRDYLRDDIPRAVGERFGVSQIGCGLCQTGVPCEGAIPPGNG
ncbi:MAG: epoxyqueuosine reductase [Thermodesulfobacteriota bacterium]